MVLKGLGRSGRAKGRSRERIEHRNKDRRPGSTGGAGAWPMARRSPARSAPSSVSTPQSSYCGSVPHAPARSQRIRRRVIVCDLDMGRALIGRGSDRRHDGTCREMYAGHCGVIPGPPWVTRLSPLPNRDAASFSAVKGDDLRKSIVIHICQCDGMNHR